MKKGRPFQKGQSGNPGGRPKVPEALKAIRRLSNEQIAEIGTIILYGNKSDLIKIQQDPASTNLQLLICQVLINAMNEGDHSAMNAILDRIVGKIPAPVELAGNSGGPIEIVIKDYTSKKK